MEVQLQGQRSRSARNRIDLRLPFWLVQVSTQAISSLANLAQSAESESARIQACKAIVEIGFKGVLNSSIQERLAAIEQDIENGR